MATLLRFLSNSAWQGIGVIVAIIIFMYSVLGPLRWRRAMARTAVGLAVLIAAATIVELKIRNDGLEQQLSELRRNAPTPSPSAGTNGNGSTPHAPVIISSSQELPAPHLIIMVGKEQTSNWPGISVVLSKIEQWPTRSRWYFDFKNASDTSRPCLYLNHEQTYISADKTLAHFRIKQTNDENTWLEPKQLKTVWFEFDTTVPDDPTDYSVLFMNTFPMGYLGCNVGFKTLHVRLSSKAS